MTCRQWVFFPLSTRFLGRNFLTKSLERTLFGAYMSRGRRGPVFDLFLVFLFHFTFATSLLLIFFLLSSHFFIYEWFPARATECRH